MGDGLLGPFYKLKEEWEEASSGSLKLYLCTAMDPKHRPVLIWLLLGAVLIAAMVVIGGITRLTHSGLSMVDWDPIMGSIPPTNEAEWKDAFEQYKQFPEYQKKNYDMKLEGFKSIYFWEYLHRMWGRMMGLVFIIPFGIFIVQGRIRGELLKQCLLILLGGALVAGLGWFMVLSGLKDRPDVSHYRLAIHLVAAFSLFAYVLWTAFDLRWPSQGDPPQDRKGTINWGRAFLVLLMLQVVYGAFVAGMGAGTFFNTWPRMGNAWFPEAVSSLEPLWRNFFEGKAGVQFVHRSLAILLFLMGVGILSRLFSGPTPGPLQRAGFLFGASLLLQFLLGIFTLILEVPIVLAVLHQVGALLLLATNLYLLHRAKGVS
jgi:cytochrome c oxidase assembly protein subunit 15